jgi:Beta-galactosidase trimerisation domain
MPRQLIPQLKIGALTIKTRMHKEVLEPLNSAKVIGSFSTGEPAVVENRYGKGRAIYLGTNPFISYMATADPNLLKWLHQIHGDIKRHAWTNLPDVISRVLVNGKSKIVFLLNTLEKPATVTLSVPVDGQSNVRELIDGRKVAKKLAGQTMTIREKLGSYGTKIYVVE